MGSDMGLGSSAMLRETKKKAMKASLSMAKWRGKDASYGETGLFMRVGLKTTVDMD